MYSSPNNNSDDGVEGVDVIVEVVGSVVGAASVVVAESLRVLHSAAAIASNKTRIMTVSRDMVWG